MVYLPSIYSDWKIVGNAFAHSNPVLFVSTNSVNGINLFCFNLIVDSVCANSFSDSLCAIRVSYALVLSTFNV